MHGIKVAAFAAALLGAGLGSAEAAPIGTGLPHANPAAIEAAYQYHYFCAPWNEAWGYPGCQGYYRHLDEQLSRAPAVTCHVRRTRHGLRRICRRG